MQLEFINDIEKSENFKFFRHILSMPFIYSMAFPIIALDIFISIYQYFAFPLYWIEKVKRKDYIIYDREFLSHLNRMQKLNCLYCTYSNGLLAYSVEIAGRTERYWCPIKHSKKMEWEHKYVQDFAEFWDAKLFQEKYNEIENTWIYSKNK